MTEHFVWNPVGNRLATPEEFEQRVNHRLQAPGVMPTGKQPERDSVCLVTTSNGDVDLDESCATLTIGFFTTVAV